MNIETNAPQAGQLDALLDLVARRQDLTPDELMSVCLQYGRESKDARGRAKGFWIELKFRFKAITGKGSRSRKIAVFGVPSFKAFLEKHNINHSTVYYLLGGRPSTKTVNNKECVKIATRLANLITVNDIWIKNDEKQKQIISLAHKFLKKAAA